MADVIKYRFRCRRRTAAEWTTVNEVLLDSEIGLEEDTGLGKIGDGSTAWNDLLYTIVGRVDLTGITDGSGLIWDTASSKWKIGAAGGQVNTVVAGTNVSVDSADPVNPVVSSTLGAIQLKGRVATYAALPSSGNTSGDAWLVDADKLIYVWDGSAWPTTGAGVHIASVATRKWWRIYVTDTVGNAGTASLAITQIQMRAASGGVNVGIGATAFASSNYSASKGAAAPFATSPSADPGWVAYGAMPQFIGVQLATPTVINEVQIRIRALDAVNAPLQAPKNFIIQSSVSSSNGTNGQWIDEWAVYGQTGWALNENRIFTRS